MFSFRKILLRLIGVLYLCGVVPLATASVATFAPNQLCEGTFKLDNNIYGPFIVNADNRYLYHLINKAWEEHPLEVSEYLNQISSECGEHLSEDDGLYEYSMSYSSSVCPTWILIDHELTGFYETDEPFLMHIDAEFFRGIGNPGYKNMEKIPDFKKRYIGSCDANASFMVNGKNMDVYAYRSYLSGHIGQTIVQMAIKAGWDKKTLQEKLIPNLYDGIIKSRGLPNHSRDLPKILYKTETNLWCVENTDDKCTGFRSQVEGIYAEDSFYSSQCNRLFLKPQHTELRMKYTEFVDLLFIESDIPNHLSEQFKDESWSAAENVHKEWPAVKKLGNLSSSERDNRCSEFFDTDINRYQVAIDKMHQSLEERVDQMSETQMEKYNKIRRKPKKRSF